LPIPLSFVYLILAIAGVGLNLLECQVGAGLIKALPALYLVACAWVFTRTRFSFWIPLAALFGAAGDFSLASAERDWFMAGLVTFLIGHLAYCVAFARHLRWTRTRGVVIGLTLLGTLLLLGAVLVRFIHAGEYAIIVPVIVYVTVMGVMMVLGVLHDSTSRLIAAGGVVFIISDAHIAVNHMLLTEPVQAITLTGYSTYYLAQYLLVSGAIHEARYTD